MLKNEGYILLESLISLVILIGLVYGYLGLTQQMEKQDAKRMAQLAGYEQLYQEVRRYRLHQKRNDPEVELAFTNEKMAAYLTKGEVKLAVEKK